MSRARAIVFASATLFGGAVCASAAEAPPAEGAVLSSGTAHQALFAVTFNGAMGIAVGAVGDIRESTDAGRTWKQVKSPTQQALLGVAMNAERAIAVGQKGTILVRDKSGEWRAVEQSVSKERLFAIAMTEKAAGSSPVAIAVGSFGALLRSTDGGAHWESVAPRWQDYSVDGADPNLYSVHVGDDGTILIAGEFGIVARSTDNGATWESKHKGAATLFDLALQANGVGYAVGQDGEVVKTVDGGVSWANVDAGIKTNLLAVAIDPNGRIYATGMHETYAGRDDGKPWSELASSATQGLWHAGLKSTTAVNEVIAVGQTAQILRLGK